VAGAGLAARRLRLYVPHGHEPERASPLLVMFDGQNVFDDAGSFAGGWHLHRAIERLARRRVRPLVLAVDHGGHERVHELSPFEARGSRGQADVLLGWLIERVLPEVRRRHMVIEGPAGLAVGGSSLGGLAALYAHFRYPEIFGGALAMSPSLWLGGARFLEWVRGVGVPWTTRIYLDAGANEGGMLRLAEALSRELGAKGLGDRLLFKADPKGGHSERHWRRRLPAALRFFYR
jgi:enterochelin esterase-like enzyme